MGVVFHLATGVALAAVLCKGSQSRRMSGLDILRRSLVAVPVGVGIHAILDITPHQYPLGVRPDIALGVAMIVLIFGMAQFRALPIVAGAIFGSVLPDLVDLGPQMVNGAFGWSLPSPQEKVFPWHREPLSGSIFDGSRRVFSYAAHAVVLGGSVFVVWARRESGLWRVRITKADL